MLADSTEAIVRSSRDHSHERIDALVESVIAERLAEGQFDECDLTLKDLRTIAESFKATLRAMYHARIEYPAPTETEKRRRGLRVRLTATAQAEEAADAPPVPLARPGIANTAPEPQPANGAAPNGAHAAPHADPPPAEAAVERADPEPQPLALGAAEDDR